MRSATTNKKITTDIFDFDGTLTPFEGGHLFSLLPSEYHNIMKVRDTLTAEEQINLENFIKKNGTGLLPDIALYLRQSIKDNHPIHIISRNYLPYIKCALKIAGLRDDEISKITIHDRHDLPVMVDGQMKINRVNGMITNKVDPANGSKGLMVAQILRHTVNNPEVINIYDDSESDRANMSNQIKKLGTSITVNAPHFSCGELPSILPQQLLSRTISIGKAEELIEKDHEKFYLLSSLDNDANKARLVYYDGKKDQVAIMNLSKNENGSWVTQDTNIPFSQFLKNARTNPIDIQAVSDLKVGTAEKLVTQNHNSIHLLRSLDNDLNKARLVFYDENISRVVIKNILKNENGSWVTDDKKILLSQFLAKNNQENSKKTDPRQQERNQFGRYTPINKPKPNGSNDHSPPKHSSATKKEATVVISSHRMKH